jgi:hypothetical protein
LAAVAATAATLVALGLGVAHGAWRAYPAAGAHSTPPPGAAVVGTGPTRSGATPASPSGEAAPQAPRLEVLAHEPLGGRGQHADIWLHRGFVYVGTWSVGADPAGCPGTGVKVVDLTDLRQPLVVGTLAAHEGSSAEVVRVRGVRTPTFTGDLLGVGLLPCNTASDALRGLDLWDVTDPRTPRWLGFFSVGAGTKGVHELDLVQRPDGQVLALLTVEFSEMEHPDGLGDFRIVDVTDPRAPVPLADWGAGAALGLGQHDGVGSDPDIFAHSARASADGMRVYVSYWDAGVLILDLADPAAPRLVGRTTFPPGAEGNAHSVDLAQNGRLLVEASEILFVDSPALRVESPPELAGLVRAGGTLPAPPWPDTPSVTGALAYVGRGCPAGDWEDALPQGARVAVPDPYLGDPRGRIALLDRGGCLADDKLERVQAAGAVGAVIVNTADTPIAFDSEDGSPLGAFGIPWTDGERLKAALAAGREVLVTLSDELSVYQDFGSLRFWDLSEPALPRVLGTYHTPRTHVDPVLGPAERGVFSAHNPVVQGDLLFVSWYSDGVRVLDIRDPAAPREVAAWMPPTDAAPAAVRSIVGPGPQVWGVAVDGDLVVASDVNSGLWVLRFVRG